MTTGLLALSAATGAANGGSLLFSATNLTVPQVRVVVVTHYFSTHRGGVKRVAGELASRIAASGRFAITWISSNTDSPPAPPENLAVVPVAASNLLERFGFPWPLWGPRGLRTLRRAIHDADIVHVHDFIYFGSIAAFVLARRMKKPFVITQHIGEVPLRNPLLSTLIRAINRTIGRHVLSRADRVVFISDAVRRYFTEFVPFTHEPRFVPNGVDTAVFRPVAPEKRAQARTLLGLRSSDLVVLYVGRFVGKKGLPLLGELARMLPQYKWWFAGWGVSGASAHPLSWGLSHVRVFGNRSGATLAEIYCASDLLVLASLSEGFPLVVKEAMACGTPVLIADRIADGAPEARPLLRLASIDGPTATAVWNDAIAKALEESAGGSRVEALVAFAHARWAWSTTVAQYRAIFDELYVTQSR